MDLSHLDYKKYLLFVITSKVFVIEISEGKVWWYHGPIQYKMYGIKSMISNCTNTNKDFKNNIY